MREYEVVTASLAPDSPAQRKARGAFFTPEAVARYVTQWAVRSADDSVLEPSCGEAAFLLEAGRHLVTLGAKPELMSLHGAELHEASASNALALLAHEGLSAQISVGDFFKEEPRAAYDAVIGNPPYVRYQSFSGDSRAASRRAALRAGVKLTNLASSWAAFTVHAALFVKDGGRLGLVLPAELLSVNYAAPVREFLMRSFSRVRLVLFTERVFPGVLEEVVLVLAEGKGEGPTDHCELLQARNGAALADLDDSDVTRWAPRVGERWSSLHLSDLGEAAYRKVLAAPGFVDLEAWGDTTLGMVTGANRYFALTGAEAARLKLPGRELLRLSPPGSRHLRALSLSTKNLDALDGEGAPTWLFRPAGSPSPSAARYIAEGEAAQVHVGYKCRIRSPWWRVPYLAPADLLLTYMNADTARLCENRAGAHHLNSVHGVYLSQELRALGKQYLPIAALNSVTLLGAEVVGRAYGGGILKLEPREADRWPMPSPALVRARSGELRSVRRRVRDLLGAGRLFEAVEVVDGALFQGEYAIPAAELQAIRTARAALHDRRLSRTRGR